MGYKVVEHPRVDESYVIYHPPVYKWTVIEDDVYNVILHYTNNCICSPKFKYHVCMRNGSFVYNDTENNTEIPDDFLLDRIHDASEYGYGNKLEYAIGSWLSNKLNSEEGSSYNKVGAKHYYRLYDSTGTDYDYVYDEAYTKSDWYNDPYDAFYVALSTSGEYISVAFLNHCITW